LPDGRDRRIDHLIAKDHCERFVPDEVLGAEDRVPQTPGVPLADITKICQLRNPADLVEQLLFSASFKVLFQLEGHVEVVFNGPFPPARDDDDVLNAGVDRFLDRILDQGLIYQRKRSEEHTSELQSRFDLVCRLLLEKKKYKNNVCT